MEWLVRAALRTVPSEWRESVHRDLLEEAGAHARPARSWFVARHAFAVGFRFRVRAVAEGGAVLPRPSASGVMTDVRVAIRTLRRRPQSALVVAGTLGLGIGAATAMFAVFNHVVFRQVPGVVEAGRLVTLYYQANATEPTRTSASIAHLEAMSEEAIAMDGLAAWQRREVGFGVDLTTAPEELTVTAVSRHYFDVLGVRARAGRLFAEEELREGHAVLVVSERFAHSRPDITVGSDVYLNGQPYRIIGVAADFRGLDRLGRDDVWAPYRASLTRDAVDRPLTVFAMVGRLRDGVTLEQAQARLRAASRAVGVVTTRSTTFQPILFPGLTDGLGVTRDRLVRMYTILMAGVAMLFVLACANAANLLVARNLRRRRDFAMRAALGAGRLRLMRELSIEAAALAGFAALLGLGITVALGGVFRGTHLLSYLPPLDSLQIDGRVIAFCASAAGVTVLLFGVAPAVIASRADPIRGLRETNRATRRTGLRAGLAALQLTLSLTLLVSAGLLARTMWRLQSLELGLDADDVVTLRLEPYGILRDEVRTDAVLRATRDRLAAARSIEGVALSWASPFGSAQRLMVRRPDAGTSDEIPVITHYVSSEYFDVLRMRMLSGRAYTLGEALAAKGSVRPAVVNESFAREWLGTANVAGLSLPARDASGEITLDIIGVVADARHRDLREGFVPMIYHPAAGHLRVATLLVRTSSTPPQTLSLARNIVHQIEPSIPVGEVGTLRDDIDTNLAEERLLARLSSMIALIAGLLAVSGLYAVIAFSVNERVRELAIRMALGASRRRVVGLVLRRVIAILVVGFAAGLGLVLASSRVLASRLFGVAPLDPPTLAAAVVLLGGAAFLAVWSPARRATRIDPMESLRVD